MICAICSDILVIFLANLEVSLLDPQSSYVMLYFMYSMLKYGLDMRPAIKKPINYKNTRCDWYGVIFYGFRFQRL